MGKEIQKDEHLRQKTAPLPPFTKFVRGILYDKSIGKILVVENIEGHKISLPGGIFPDAAENGQLIAARRIQKLQSYFSNHLSLRVSAKPFLIIINKNSQDVIFAVELYSDCEQYDDKKGVHFWTSNNRSYRLQSLWQDPQSLMDKGPRHFPIIWPAFLEWQNSDNKFIRIVKP